jgi:hypothetical protein
MLTIVYHADLYRDTMLGRRVTAREWGLMAKAFEVDNIYCVDDEGRAERSGRITRVSTIAEVEALHPEQWVYVEHMPGDPATLTDFRHPADVVYCFGADSTGMLGKQRNQGTWVTIATPNDGGLYADQAAAIILYDRLVKG